jgi:hypothetical protein
VQQVAVEAFDGNAGIGQRFQHGLIAGNRVRSGAAIPHDPIGAGRLGHRGHDRGRIAAPEHQAAEALGERREAMMQPPAAGRAGRAAAVFVEDVQRHDPPAFRRRGERRIVADAQVLAKPDDGGHDAPVRPAPARGSLA